MKIRVSPQKEKAPSLAAVIEEADVVALRDQRLDLGLDEALEFGVIGFELGRNREIHLVLPQSILEQPPRDDLERQRLLRAFEDR